MNNKLLTDIEAIDAQIARIKELTPNNPILTSLLTVRERKQEQINGANSVTTPKVDTSTVQNIQTPVIGFNDGTPIALAGESEEQDNEMAEIARDVDKMVLSNSFICSKGCGKVCTSNAGKVSHERACKFVI